MEMMETSLYEINRKEKYVSAFTVLPMVWGTQKYTPTYSLS